MENRRRSGGAAQPTEIAMTDRRYWFPRETLRLGLGPAAHVAGLVALAALVALIAAASWLFSPLAVPAAFATCVVVVAALLTAVCCLTAEPLRWRWGGDQPGM